MDTRSAIKLLKEFQPYMKRHEVKTIRGQIIAGDIKGAITGIIRIKNRREMDS